MILDCMPYHSREVTFESKDVKNPAQFYFNSVTAHRNYPDKKVTKADAIVAEMGSLEGSNHRCINKMLVSQVLPTCQLQMGMTELKPGSVWNTMPAHVHSRRMEEISPSILLKVESPDAVSLE